MHSIFCEYNSQTNDVLLYDCISHLYDLKKKKNVISDLIFI